MKIFFLSVLSLIAAGISAQLFWKLLDQFLDIDWLGSSYRADDLHETHFFYAFCYILVLAVALFFRWPISVRRLVASAIILVGAILPLVSVCVRYWRGFWPLQDVFALEKGALSSLLLSHGIVLLVFNVLYYLAHPKGVVPGVGAPAGASAAG